MKIHRLTILTFAAISLLIFLFTSFAQGYSKQDIRDLIDYFREYDSKAKPFIVAQSKKIDELVNQAYEDLQNYKDKESLRKFIEGLHGKLIDSCARLVKLSERVDVRQGFYNPRFVSPEFNKLNLESAYILLRIKILGYLYQYKYNELALKKDICCPLFYIYSTGNKVKSCTGQ